MYTSTVFRSKWFLVILIGCCSFAYQAYAQTPVYLLPGQGSDDRLYQDLELGTSYELRHIPWAIPSKGMSMHAFAKYLSQHIATDEPYIIVGTSLGGMLATEMSTFLQPEKTIIISSAKSRKELPHRYRFQRFVPIYKLIPASWSKVGAQLLQPLVEPDRNQNKEVFVQMLKDKPPLFLPRTIEMIIRWERKDAPGNIIHIHGDHDHTLPHKHVNYDYLIPDGSHMMALTEAEKISALLREILNQEE